MYIRPLRNHGASSLAIAILLVAGFAWARSALTTGPRRPPQPLRVSLDHAQLLANGYQTATLHIEPAAPRPQISFDPSHLLTLDDLRRTPTAWQARLRAGVLPGRVQLRITAAGFLPATAAIDAALDPSDRLDDGTPDFLRLDSDDAQIFRRWFTFLAEAQYFQGPAARPREIDDCAALIRYAYREALRNHDSAWAAGVRLPLLPALDSIEKYDYPHTPLAAALFRTRPGAFHPSDLADGTFTQFADVRTLYRLNTHFVTRDLTHALPGDLLFFRQLSDHMPFHSMIYLGKSQIAAGDPARYVVYHTGPTGADPGEIRRPALTELLNFPDPRWRPMPANPSFLGVYRWNILEKEF